ncbi:MAG TPA: hypothetical protein VHM65_04250 [Candidatus Lustribacter sp.]|nr:hypothetical protein [Candidatus Lustribacter sp.]
MTSANIGSALRVMEVGDTFTVTFSEPLNPRVVLAANAKQTDPSGPGNDLLTIVGLTNGALDLGADTFVTPDGGSIVYPDSTMTMLNANTAVRSAIVGECSGSACGSNGPGATASLSFEPEPFIKDLNGNPAEGTLTQVVTLY